MGYVVSASGDAAYGAVLLEQEGRADIATVAVAPGAAGQEQVPSRWVLTELALAPSGHEG